MAREQELYFQAHRRARDWKNGRAAAGAEPSSGERFAKARGSFMAATG